MGSRISSAREPTVRVVQSPRFPLTLAEVLQFLKDFKDSTTSEVSAFSDTVHTILALDAGSEDLSSYLITRDVASEACAADINRDGVVNFGDLALMKGVFFQSCAP